MKRFFPMILFVLLGVLHLSASVSSIPNTTNSPPFVLTVESMLVEDGYEVCVPMRVDGFENIKAMQFTLKYNTWKLTLNDAFAHYDNSFPEFWEASGNGTVTFKWNNAQGDGLTLDDGTVFAEICFTVSGYVTEEVEITMAPLSDFIVADGNNMFVEDVAIETGVLSIVEDAILCQEQGGDILCESWMKEILEDDYLDLTTHIEQVAYYSSGNYDCFIDVVYTNDDAQSCGKTHKIYTLTGDEVVVYDDECDITQHGYVLEDVLWGGSENFPDCVVGGTPPLVELEVEYMGMEDGAGCIDIYAQNFVDISYFELGVRYENKLSFVNAFGGGLPGFSDANYSVTETLTDTYSEVTFEWGDILNDEGTTLDDGSALLTLCFESPITELEQALVEIKVESPALSIVTSESELAPVEFRNGYIVMNAGGGCDEYEAAETVCTEWIKEKLRQDYTSGNYKFKRIDRYIDIEGDCYFLFTRISGGVVTYLLYDHEGNSEMQTEEYSDLLGYFNVGKLWGEEEGYPACALYNPDENVVLKVKPRVIPSQDEACVGIRVDNFGGVASFGFDLQYDAEVLQAQNVWSNSLLGFETEHYDINEANGVISIDWSTSHPHGVFVHDYTNLVNVCFVATGDEGTITDLEFVANSVTMSNSSGGGMFFDTEDGVVTIGDNVDCSEIADFDACEIWMRNVLTGHYVNSNFSDTDVYYVKGNEGDCFFLFEKKYQANGVYNKDYQCYSMNGEHFVSGRENKLIDYGFIMDSKELIWSDVDGYPDCVIDYAGGPMYLDVQDAIVAPGDDFCIGVESVGFYNAVGFQFAMRYDADVLELTDVNTPFNDFSNSNWANYPDYADEYGAIIVAWTDTLVQPNTLQGGVSLLELCFNAIGDEGDVSEVTIENSVIEVEVIHDSGHLLPLFCTPGQVTITNVTTDPTPTCEHDFNEMLCDDWMKDALLERYSMISNMCGQIVHYLSPDGTCVIDFEGEQSCTSALCEDHTIYDLEGGLMEEYTSICDLQDMGYTDKQIIWTTEDGLPDCIVDEVTLDPVIFDVTSTTISEGGQGCVDVQVENFTGISSMQFGIVYDEELLDFVSLSTDVLGNFAESNYANSDGVMLLSWTAADITNGITLADEEILFEVCFMAAQGTAGSVVDVIVGTPPPVEIITDVEGVFVELDVELIGGQITIEPGDVTACNYDFDEMICEDWMKNLLLQNYSLEADMCGEIACYQSPEGECVIGFVEEQACAETACPDHVIYDMSGNEMTSYTSICDLQDMGYTDKQMIWNTDMALPGCIDEEETLDAVVFEVTSTTISEGGQGCVDVQVENFTDILSMQFGITYDEELLDFASMSTGVLEGFSVNNYIDYDGVTSLTWIAVDLANGTTLVDGESLFEICFTAAEGTAGSVTDVIVGVPPVIEIMADVQGQEVELDVEVIGGQITIEPGDVTACNYDFDEMICEDWMKNLLLQNYSLEADMCGEIACYQSPESECVIGFVEEQACAETACPDHVIYDMNGNEMVAYTSICDLQDMGYTDKQMIWNTDMALPSCIEVTPLQDTIVFTVVETTIGPSGTDCVEIKVDNFVDIISFQLGLDFDQTVFELTTINGHSLLNLMNSNYTVQSTGVYMSWVADDLINGVTLSDEETLMEVCFSYTGTGTDTMNLSLASSPIVEILDNDETEIPWVFFDGDITGSSMVNTTNVTATDAMSYTIFPNPTSRFITIDFDNKAQQIESLTLISIDGKTTKALSTNTTNTFDIGALPAGMYLCQVQTKDGVLTRKLIIK